MLSIGQVAEQTGTSVETIRYYEREGLIAKPQRATNGYRQYPPEVVHRIGFIKRCKELGFTLKEISELLALRVTPNVSCGDIKLRAIDKINDIDARLRTLTNMKHVLEKLVLYCHSNGPVDACPILEALDPPQHMPQ